MKKRMLPPTPHVEFVASCGQSKVTYWVSREEGAAILAAHLAPAFDDCRHCDCPAHARCPVPAAYERETDNRCGRRGGTCSCTQNAECIHGSV